MNGKDTILQRIMTRGSFFYGGQFTPLYWHDNTCSQMQTSGEWHLSWSYVDRFHVLCT